MKMIWNKETGEARGYETVDAREILKNSDLYTDVDPNEDKKSGEEQPLHPVNVANVENEFRREPVGMDNPEKPREQPIIRNAVTDRPRMVDPAALPIAQEEKSDFDDMTVAEMREYAEKHDIDLGDATLKADIAKKLKKAS